ncbi:MAG: signal peptidase I [Lachnospiraceae bacterium]|nr:signal peptidase I [Lachnospiraceae bacterium]
MAMRRKSVEEHRILYDLMRWILDIVVVMGIAAFLTIYMGEQMTVTGYSMAPVLANEERILIDKLSYHFFDPERFDIVIFQNGEEEKYFLKRIIGLPGETVCIKNGRVMINGEYLQEEIETDPILNPGLALEEITLGEDEYFLLGDNRNNSEDSRFETVGNVKRGNIVGKAWLLVTTLDEVGLIK